MIKFGKESTKPESSNTTELFSGVPVMAVLPNPVEGSRTYRFNLNRVATTVLNFQNTPVPLDGFRSVALGYDGEGNVYIANVTNVAEVEEKDRLRVTLANEIASKPYHQYLVQKFTLDATIKNYFMLQEVPDNVGFFKLSLIEQPETSVVPEGVTEIVTEVPPEPAEVPQDADLLHVVYEDEAPTQEFAELGTTNVEDDSTF